ncbi:MAG: DUF1501 domain-containing protein, partial [Pirellulaceae bacterium]
AARGERLDRQAGSDRKMRSEHAYRWVFGRDHTPWGFTVGMAGGGVRGGMAYGATDPFGFKAVENKVHIHDLHATILHLMGFDHTRLTYRHAGRDYRLTDVFGKVVQPIVS